MLMVAALRPEPVTLSRNSYITSSIIFFPGRAGTTTAVHAARGFPHAGGFRRMHVAPLAWSLGLSILAHVLLYLPK